MSPVPGTGPGPVMNSCCDNQSFPLSAEMEGRKRWQEATACWLLWASQVTLLGLSFLVCRIASRRERLPSHLATG